MFTTESQRIRQQARLPALPCSATGERAPSPARCAVCSVEQRTHCRRDVLDALRDATRETSPSWPSVTALQQVYAGMM